MLGAVTDVRLAAAAIVSHSSTHDEHHSSI